jgi:predicted SAM-dependent methyltransferase
MRKLEIGCGWKPTPGYVRVDVNENIPDLDWCGDARGPFPFGDGEFVEIRAVDILEHIPYQDTLHALREWARMLCSGGRLYVQVPDARTAVEWYLHQPHRIQRDAPYPNFPPIVSLAWRLMGGQDDGHFVRDGDDWRLNAHYALFDAESLKWYVREAGLQLVSLQVNQFPNLLCWARKP